MKKLVFAFGAARARQKAIELEKMLYMAFSVICTAQAYLDTVRQDTNPGIDEMRLMLGDIKGRIFVYLETQERKRARQETPVNKNPTGGR